MTRATSSRISGLDRLDPQRILLCQQRQIGDVIMLTPSLHMMKQRFPQADIDVVTEKKCAPVLENNPEVAHVWEIDRSLGFFRSLFFYRKVGRGGGRGRYDLIVDFQQLPRLRWIMAFSDCRVKLSYPPPWYNRPLYTHWAPASGCYSALCKASVIMHAFGIPWENYRPRIYLTNEERRAAAEQLAAWGLRPGDALVTVDPTHRRSTRVWPLGHYAQLLAAAWRARPQLKFLVLYGPGERQAAEPIVDLAEKAGLPPERLILPPRQTALREVPAMQSFAALHLGNDSSPQHFAVGVNTPTFTIIGGGGQAWTFPGPGHEDITLTLPCQPCGKSDCPLGDLRCLRQLRPDLVLPRFLENLDRALARSRTDAA